MKINYNFALILSLSMILLSCTKEEGNEKNPESLPPEFENNLKYISEISGSDNTTFVYEEDLLIKGWEQNSGIFFEVEYNSQNKVTKVYTCECGPWLDGQELNIREDFPDSFLTFEYYYNNGLLSEIKSNTGKILTTLKYNNNNQVTEYYSAGRYSDDYDDYELTNYIYSSGKIDSYTYYESYSEQTMSGEIEVDDKINPLFVLWSQYGLIIPDDISEISTYNIPFFENNVLTIYNSNEIDSKATISYEENYPIYYEEIFSRGDGTIIKYKEN